MGTNNMIDDPDLGDPLSETDPNFVPGSGSPAIGAGVAPPDDGFFDSDVDFVGAIGTVDWTEGWTEFPEN